VAYLLADFGEVMMWWGIWLVNLDQNWWTVVGPMTITFLILKVSGVPLLEAKYALLLCRYTMEPVGFGDLNFHSSKHLEVLVLWMRY